MSPHIFSLWIATIFTDCWEEWTNKVCGRYLAWAEVLDDWKFYVSFLCKFTDFQGRIFTNTMNIRSSNLHFKYISTGLNVSYLLFCPKIDRKSGPKVYEVTMDDAAIIGGPFGYPLEFGKKFILEIL